MFVQRNQDGDIVGIWMFPVEGQAEEELDDNDPEIIEFRENHDPFYKKESQQ